MHDEGIWRTCPRCGAEFLSKASSYIRCQVCQYSRRLSKTERIRLKKLYPEVMERMRCKHDDICAYLREHGRATAQEIADHVHTPTDPEKFGRHLPHKQAMLRRKWAYKHLITLQARGLVEEIRPTGYWILSGTYTPVRTIKTAQSQGLQDDAYLILEYVRRKGTATVRMMAEEMYLPRSPPLALQRKEAQYKTKEDWVYRRLRYLLTNHLIEKADKRGYYRATEKTVELQTESVKAS